MSAETLEREAIQELAAILKLPPASGTVAHLVRLLLDAAVARIEEGKQSPAAPAPIPFKQPLGLRK